MAQKLTTRSRHCAACGAGLLHFRSVWRVTETNRSLDLCSSCARDAMARLEAADAQALCELEALARLLPNALGDACKEDGPA